MLKIGLRHKFCARGTLHPPSKYTGKEPLNMKKASLLAAVILLLSAILGANAPLNPDANRPLYAPRLLKVQLTSEAVSRAKLPLGLYAESGSFGLNELDQLLAVNGGVKIIRAHRQVKDAAWAERVGWDRWFLIQLDGKVRVEDALVSFEANRYIERACPEYIAYAAIVPNDTYYPNNWGHNNTAQLPVYQSGGHTGPGVGTIGFDSDAQLAWNQSQIFGSASIIIAVIDTGVDTTHPDLRLVTGYDYGDNDSNPMDDSDDPGHGTSCSGVAAGKANNALGVTGIAGGCSVMPLKVANSAGDMYFTAIDNALTHAADYNADIISMSLGAEGGTAEGDSPSTDAALYYAYNAGVAIFAATANSNTSTIAYPANHTSVISIGASSPTGQRKSTTSSDGEYWWGSNYGTSVQDAKEAVDLMAPTILPATDLVGSVGYSTTDYYMWFNGTSCATPYAAGVAALVLSKDPSLTPAQLRNLLASTATDMTLDGGAGWDRYTGYGMVNANSALNALIPGMPACQITAPLNGAVLDLGSTVTVNVNATDSDGTIAGVAFYIDSSIVPNHTDTTSPYSWSWNTLGYSAGAHTIRAVATDDSSNTATSTVTVNLIAPPDEGFETGDFSLLPWTQSGNLPWTVQNADRFSGSFAAKSGAITHNQTSSLSVTLNITAAGNISFYQKVSSEATYDFLYFYIDNVQQGSWSGAGSWTAQTYAVSTGSHTFKWTYAKDGYVSSNSDCAFLDHIDFPAYSIPNQFYPPQNLSAAPGNGFVTLSWQAPAYGTPTGYKVFRDGALLTNVTGLGYTDYAVVNGTSYAYHLTAVYAQGESDPTPEVLATPNFVSYVDLGTGTSATNNNQINPISNTYKSIHGQSVYTAAELNAAGVYGPVLITQFGFYPVGQPNLALANFVVRLMHTPSSNVSSWITGNLTTVYSNAAYMPTTGGYDMLTLSTPFEWNGTDNILIDTAFGMLANYSQTGTLRYTTVTNGYRRIGNDTANQTNVFTGGGVRDWRPNVRLGLQPVTQGPEIDVNPPSLDFGEAIVGSSPSQVLTLSNLGDQPLTGSLSSPLGYTLAEVSRASGEALPILRTRTDSRNTLSFSLPPSSDQDYVITFTPTAVAAYEGNIVVSSNDADEATLNLPVAGYGYIPPTLSVDPDTLRAQIYTGGTADVSFTLGNSGSQNLNFVVGESPAVDWFSCVPFSGAIGGSGSQSITGTFASAGLAPGIYAGNLQVVSNDPVTPYRMISLELTVLNTAPALDLPASLSFGMDGSLVFDLAPYASDPDIQTLSLSCAPTSHVGVQIAGLTATFTAQPGWFGTEQLEFTLSDGLASSSDTLLVEVYLDFLAQPQLSSPDPIAGGVQLAWEPVPNATSYRVYRCLEPYGEFTLLSTVSQNSFADLEGHPQAFYRVSAVYGEPTR